MTRPLQLLLLSAAGLFAAEPLPFGGFAHVGFRVGDLEKTSAFYTGVLGMRQAFDQKDPSGKVSLAVFQINDDQFLEFVPGLAAGGGDRMTHIAFLTTRLESLRQLVDALGLKPPELRTGRDRTRNFSIKDPDGHRVEFVQYEADSLQTEARGKSAGAKRVSPRLDHAAFAVGDRDKAVEFYSGRLGFSERNGVLHSPSSVDGVRLLPAGEASYLCFEVADVAAARRTLHERGVSADTLRDPDGMTIQLKAPSR